MTEPIFARLITEGHQALSEARTSWERATSHLHHHEVTMTANPADPTPQGAPMSLSQIAADFRAKLEEGETALRTALDEHLPALEGLARAVDSDPLITAVEAAVLPPDVRVFAAEFITKLAALHAPAPAAPEAPAEPTPAAADMPAEALAQ